MLHQSPLAVLVLLVFAAGCATIVRSEAELFARKHPELRKHYTRLSPTDADSIKERAEIIFRSREWAIGAMTNRLSGEAIANEVAEMRRFASVAREEEMKTAEELEMLAKPNRSEIYKYEFRDGQKAEWGFLVLRDGEVVGKVNVRQGMIYD